MKDLLTGVKEIASPRGIGNAIGIFFVFALLFYVAAVTPTNIVERAKARFRKAA